jgi:NRPS condensation-like uncharacterized protein
MDSSINYNEWYKLDNAAKIFPAVSSDENSNIFRISAWLYEDVDKEILQKALEKILPRFPSFSAKLRKGFFWYFLDHNANKPLVREESPHLYKKMRPQDENGFLFRVYYYRKRLSLEMFHSLSDGYGGLEFLKSLLFHYLELKGYDVKSQSKIKTATSPYSLRELEDSFFINYEKSSLSAIKDEAAYHIPGITFIQGGSGLISGECAADKMNALAKSNNVTMGEYITAVYVYSILNTQPSVFNSKRPIAIFVPVNLRRFFKSETLRNFSNFTKISVDTYKKNYTFKELLVLVKEQMAAQLNKEVLVKRMSGGVSAEKILFFRLIPLFIKIPVLKFFYRLLGEKLSTSSFSNMGKVDLPESMMPYVDKFDFSMSATRQAHINLAMGSYNNKLVICMTRRIIETETVRFFYTFLSDKIELNITSNSWEEENYVESVPKTNLKLKESAIIKKSKKEMKNNEKLIKKAQKKHILEQNKTNKINTALEKTHNKSENNSDGGKKNVL